MLFRAIAFMPVPVDAPDHEPEVAVFFEAASREAAMSDLQPLLAHAWGCEAEAVDFYNLWSEDDLLRYAASPTGPGDHAWLLENGWFHGPLFCRADRTLMLVRPHTLERLIKAREQATKLAQAQRLAADQHAGAARYAQYAPVATSTQVPA